MVHGNTSKLMGWAGRESKGYGYLTVEKPFSTEMHLYLRGKLIDHMYVGLFLQLSIMFHYAIT